MLVGGLSERPLTSTKTPDFANVYAQVTEPRTYCHWGLVENKASGNIALYRDYIGSK